MNKKYFLYSILIFFVTELVLLYYLISNDFPLTIISPDGKLYMNLASNLLEGKGMINTVRVEDIIVPPLFSLFMVPSLAIFNSILPFFIFQYILYGINAVILFYLTRRIFHKDLIAWIAAILYIINPVLLLNGPNYLLTETIYTTFILVITWSLINLVDGIQRKEGITKPFLLSILIITVSMLFRPHMLYVLPFMYIAAVVLAFYQLLTKKGLIISVLIPVILFGSNMLHNDILHGEVVTFENYSGQNLYIANNPNSDVEFYNTNKLEQFVEPYFYTLRDLSLSQKSKILKERSIDFILSDPLLTVERVIQRAFIFFQSISQLDKITIMLAVIGIVLSLFMLKGKRVSMVLLLYMIAGFTALSCAGLLVAGQRYRAPIVPIYLIFSSYTIYFALEMLRRLVKPKKSI